MSAPGPATSPWSVELPDYLRRMITITVTFDEATRALTSAVVHRDAGCLWTEILCDDPTNAAKIKAIPAPADGQGDVTYTAQQMRSRGFRTIEDVMAVQVTAD